MFSPDAMLEKLKSDEAREELKRLTGVSRTTVKYLLDEAEGLVTRKLIAYSKRSKRQVTIPLFNMNFNPYNGLYIWTLHCRGAARVYCIKECKKAEIDQVLKDIEKICNVLGWTVDYDTANHKSNEKKVSIFVNA